MNKISILGVGFHKLTMAEAIQRAYDMLQTEGVSTIYTPNPEIVMIADTNKAFMEVLNQADLLVADGIGIVKAAGILKTPLPERVAGYDLVQGLLGRMGRENKTAYFFGSVEGVAEEAAKKMMEKYPGLRIVGTRNGYFKAEEEETIVAEINKQNPDLVLVGLGAPRQEMWIHKYKEQLNAKVCIGVGGSLDGMAGIVKRAPKIFIRLNLEWFYRLIKQPSRFKRILVLPLFMIKVMRTKNGKGR